MATPLPSDPDPPGGYFPHSLTPTPCRAAQFSLYPTQLSFDPFALRFVPTSHTRGSSAARRQRHLPAGAPGASATAPPSCADGHAGASTSAEASPAPSPAPGPRSHPGRRARLGSAPGSSPPAPRADATADPTPHAPAPAPAGPPAEAADPRPRRQHHRIHSHELQHRPKRSSRAGNGPSEPFSAGNNSLRNAARFSRLQALSPLAQTFAVKMFCGSGTTKPVVSRVLLRGRSTFSICGTRLADCGR